MRENARLPWLQSPGCYLAYFHMPTYIWTYHNQGRTTGIDGPHAIMLRSVRDDCKWIFRNWSSSNTFTAELGTCLGKFEWVL